MNPLERLRYHVTGAIERGEAEPITERKIMDPISNIEEQRAIAHRVLHRDVYDERNGPDAERLAELVLALDEWRRRGGFDPYKEAAR